MSLDSISTPKQAARADALDLTLVAVRDETHDVKTFVFDVAGAKPLHAAGQSMTLRLMVDGEAAYRTFSIASAPESRGVVEMTIKAHRQGRVTRWMHDSLKPGARIEASPPRGRFTIADRSTDKLALVSAGSGASPLMAMLRHLAATAPETDVVWLHAARTPRDVLFADEIAHLQTLMPNLKVAVTVAAPASGWFGFVGRIGRRLVSVAVPDYGRRETFCCGPVGFMEEARLIHAAEGGDKALFHVEHFGPVSPSARPPAPAEAPAQGYVVTMGDKQFTASADETLLQAATRQIVIIPCGCASGMCGTCRVSLIEGSVEMQHQGGLSPEEEAGGYILACSSRPRSDVTISL